MGVVKLIRLIKLTKLLRVKNHQYWGTPHQQHLNSVHQPGSTLPKNYLPFRLLFRHLSKYLTDEPLFKSPERCHEIGNTRAAERKTSRRWNCRPVSYQQTQHFIITWPAGKQAGWWNRLKRGFIYYSQHHGNGWNSKMVHPVQNKNETDYMKQRSLLQTIFPLL